MPLTPDPRPPIDTGNQHPLNIKPNQSLASLVYKLKTDLAPIYVLSGH